MKYTHKRECLIASRSDAGGFLLMGVWGGAALAGFLAGVYLRLVKGTVESIFFTIGVVFALLAAFVAVNQYRIIQKRRKPALEMRRRAITGGAHFDGKIVDAGMVWESVAYDSEDYEGRAETRYRREPNFWIDVDYYDPEARESRRFRAERMSRSMERFIGCSVDVYVWHEWSKYIQKDLTLTYIDTACLNQ